MVEELSVGDAAVALGVNRARIHQLIRRGDLKARQVAGRWLVDPAAVAARREAGVMASRPLAPRAAWGLLMLAAGRDAPWLSASERSRARRRLLELPAAEWAWMCRNRADVRRCYAHPSVLPQMLAHPGVVASGVSAGDAYPIDLIAPAQAELYVAAGQLHPLLTRYAASESGRPNLVVRTPRALWPFDEAADGPVVAPVVVVALDLLVGSDDRTRRAGMALLEAELARIRQRARAGRRAG